MLQRPLADSLPFFNGNSSVPVITGYQLALSKTSTVEQAFTGARLVLGQLYLVQPRVTQTVRLTGICQPYVNLAIEILRSGHLDLERAVKAGELSLTEAAVMVRHPQRSFVDQFLTMSAAERADFGKRIGPVTIWDDVVTPCLT
jgi:hypothetical protein